MDDSNGFVFIGDRIQLENGLKEARLGIYNLKKANKHQVNKIKKTFENMGYLDFIKTNYESKSSYLDVNLISHVPSSNFEEWNYW